MGLKRWSEILHLVPMVEFICYSDTVDSTQLIASARNEVLFFYD